MAETNESRNVPENDEDVLRQRLLRRIGLAGVLIVALVSSLAIFDAVFVDPPVPLPVAVEAPPVAVSPEAPPAEEPADKLAETVAEPQAEAAKEAEGEKPVDKVVEKGAEKPVAPVAKAAAPSVPEHTAAPSLPPVRERPLTKPAVSQPASIRSMAAAPVAPEPARTVTKSIRPLSGADEASRRYLVQMGVFSNVANAEELKSRLDKAGIPAQIEARVQVGPFSNKIEAEAAQKKMAAMGLNGLLVSARK